MNNKQIIAVKDDSCGLLQLWYLCFIFLAISLKIVCWTLRGMIYKLINVFY